ncbi:hypothetical protein V6Z96_004906 [Aspergillus fumigatus]
MIGPREQHVPTKSPEAMCHATAHRDSAFSGGLNVPQSHLPTQNTKPMVCEFVFHGTERIKGGVNRKQKTNGTHNPHSPSTCGRHPGMQPFRKHGALYHG